MIRFQAHVLRFMRGAVEPQASGADDLRTFAPALAVHDAAEGRWTVAIARWDGA